MSKIKKKRVDSSTTISEQDIKFIKIIQFSGWIFLLMLAVVFGAWGLMDLLNIMEFEVTSLSYSFIIFMGTSAALSFALSTKINEEKGKKKEYFLDWVIGEFLLSIIAILALGAYHW